MPQQNVCLLHLIVSFVSFFVCLLHLNVCLLHLIVVLLHLLVCLLHLKRLFTALLHPKSWETFVYCPFPFSKG